MQNPRPFFLIKLAFNHTTGHLYADAQHRLGDFHVLALQERLGILGEIQRHQRTLVLSPAQFDSAVCQIAASVAGKTRAKLLGIDPADPVLVLTQVAERSGTPLYLAKCITSSHVGQLTVMQSTASVS